MTIPLSKPFWGDEEKKILLQAFSTTIGVGDGPYSKSLSQHLRSLLQVAFAYPVTSCTHALELALRVLEIQPGDEIIVPSFTMTSTANAIVLAGATPVFVDIDPVSYCIDPVDIERMITDKTKGIIVVHYAGMACDMKSILSLAKAHSLFVVEDAAHAIGASYITKKLGTIGDIGAYSFHGTKNISCGEGGAVVTNRKNLAKRMEIFRANGTNRNDFLKGLVAKYHWIGPGSSYFLSDILAGIVDVQLSKLDTIIKKRTNIANRYTDAFADFKKFVQLPIVTHGTNPNWHIYALRATSRHMCEQFIHDVRALGIEVSRHYAPLHNSPMGRMIQPKVRDLPVTDMVSKTLIRLPISPGLSESQIQYIIKSVRTILKKM